MLTISTIQPFQVVSLFFTDKNVSQLLYIRFKEGREDVNDDARPGHPIASITDENFETVKKMILNNHGITITEVADYVGMSFGLCQEVFTDVLGIKTCGSFNC